MKATGKAPTGDMRVGDRSTPPASPPEPGTVSQREFWTRELARRRVEAEALAVDPKPEDRWYRLRVLAIIRKIERDLAGVNNMPKAPAAPVKRADIGDLIAAAEADPAGDTPPDAL